MEIEIYNSKTDVAAALSKHLESWCRDEGFKTLALSGGSTPMVWFDWLAARYSQSLPWQELLFYWGDERCVPPQDPESNYGMTRKHLLDHVPVRADHVFRIHGEDAPEAEAIRYSRILEDNVT